LVKYEGQGKRDEWIKVAKLCRRRGNLSIRKR